MCRNELTTTPIPHNTEYSFHEIDLCLAERKQRRAEAEVPYEFGN